MQQQQQQQPWYAATVCPAPFAPSADTGADVRKSSPAGPPSSLPPAYDAHRRAPRTQNHHQQTTPPLLPPAMPTAASAAATPAKIHVRVPSRPGVVLVISTSRVTHIPGGAFDGTFTSREAFRDTSLTLCPRYELATPASLRHSRPGDTSICPSGAGCAYVHADHRGASEYVPHERCEAPRYPRYPPGTLVAIAKPNATTADELVPSSDILRTRVLESERRPLSHCVHFATKGRCDRGDRCYFAHVVPSPPDPNDEAATTISPLLGATSVVVGSFRRTPAVVPDVMPTATVRDDRVQPRHDRGPRAWAHRPYDAVPRPRQVASPPGHSS